MAHKLKYIGTSKYSYVSQYEDSNGKQRWLGKRWQNGKLFDTEREAAIFVDKQLLDKGREPINILIRKQ